MNCFTYKMIATFMTTIGIDRLSEENPIFFSISGNSYIYQSLVCGENLVGKQICIDNSVVLSKVATLGDLKLVEKPTAVNIAPLDFCNIKASVKVTSTENGIIFGNIVYDVNNTHSVVVLNDIHIDVMDYIVPASCTDVEFRKMWQEFEWENKVGIRF